jgi:hypothetical protein
MACFWPRIDDDTEDHDDDRYSGKFLLPYIDHPSQQQPREDATRRTATTIKYAADPAGARPGRNLLLIIIFAPRRTQGVDVDRNKKWFVDGGSIEASPNHE